MLKKTICALGAFAMMCAAAPAVSASDGTFTVSSGTVKAGGEVTVDVSVSGGNRLTAARLFVKYDATVFTLTDCDTVDFSDITPGPLSYEPFTFLWIDNNFGTAGDGTFVRLTFSCDSEAVSGDYDFSLFYEEEDCIDAYGYPLDIDIVEGKVTVTDGKPAETTKLVTTRTTDKPAETTKKTTTAKTEKQTDQKTTTQKSDTETTTSTTDSESTTTTTTSKAKADDSKDDDSSQTDTTTTSATQSVTSSQAGEKSSSSETAAAAAVSDSSSQQDEQKSSKTGLIIVIALVGVAGIAAAVFLVLKIRKEE